VRLSYAILNKRKLLFYSEFPMTFKDTVSAI
jgi:hypothetical protein